MACSYDEEMKFSMDNGDTYNYFTIDIPSLNMKKFSNPNRLEKIREIESIGFIELASHPAYSLLPRRLGGNVDLNNLPREYPPSVIEEFPKIKDFLIQNTMISEVISHLFKNKFPKVPDIGKSYSTAICATPGCTVPIINGSDHLNLCVNHQMELRETLATAEQSLKYPPAPPLNDEEVHRMAYDSLLPSIDCLLRELKTSDRSKHIRLVEQVLFAFKATIFIYRMHLNPQRDILNTIISMFLDTLKQVPEAMQAMAQVVLHVIEVVFAICGIAIIYTADLLLGDDAYLAIGLICGGGVGITWGGLQVALAGLAVSFGPIAAIGAGAAAAVSGLYMAFRRNQRQLPHPYAVQVHIGLNAEHAYLRQFFRQKSK